MQIRDVLQMLREDGWVHVRTKGSHRVFRHPTKLGTVTVAGHPSRDLNITTYRSILKQAGLEGRK